MPTVRIAHNLPRAEVRRRMEARMADLHKLLPDDRGKIDAAWKSQTAMTITVRIMGQVIKSVAANEPGALVVDYVLPKGMGFIAPMVGAVIRRAGDKLLLTDK